MGATAVGALRLTYDGQANTYLLTLDDTTIATLRSVAVGWMATVNGQSAHHESMDSVLAWALYELGVIDSYERAENLAYAVTQAWWLGGDQ